MANTRIQLAAHLVLLFSLAKSWTEATSETSPRLIITSQETTTNINLPSNNEPLYVLAGEDQKHAVTVGDEDLIFTWRNPQQKERRKVPWESCINQAVCNVHITLVQKTNDSNHVFLCGTHTKDRKTECCYMNLSAASPSCISSKMGGMGERITPIQIKREDPSVLVESESTADLYIAHSRDHNMMGLYRFGKYRLGPGDNNEVHQYVSLIYSRRESDPLQDRVYAFYKEKNKSTDPYSERWTPYVAQVCASDKGGSKKKLQFKWTSLLSARLFCGKAEDKVYFSELVDVATVRAKLWNDTKVYALFRNEWGMSAVCVYTVGDMDHVFMNSRFIGQQSRRSRECIPDSTSMELMTLNEVQESSKMEQWVQPLRSPLLFSRHHNYTHLVVDSSPTNSHSQHTLLFLSLNSGGIHKVVDNNSHFFVVAEYRPFQHRRHITGLTLHSPTRKLYVATREELVEVDVGNCANNGHTCEDCMLSRDPYCRWDNATCSPYTSNMKGDTGRGDVDICRSTNISRAAPPRQDVRVAADSPLFLRCPVTSHHAQYSWRHGGATTACSVKEQQCLLLMDGGGAKRGRYQCLAEESGHNWTVALYQLEVLSRSAGFSLEAAPRLPLMTFIVWALFLWRWLL